MKKIALSILCFFLAIGHSIAQCPMCKAAAERSMDGGSQAAAGLNKAILFLLASPYVLVAIVGFFWWQHAKKRQAAAAAAEA